MDKEITTYSSWTMFRNCRRMYFWRYIKHLAPQRKDPVMYLGGVIHDALRIFYSTGNIDLSILSIQTAMPTIEQRDDQLRAIAMMRGYERHWNNDELEALFLEQKFTGSIINTETWRESQSFSMAGKCDGVFKQTNKNFLIEHKTTSLIDAGYIERLPCDFQIILYYHYVSDFLGIKLDGILYNILQKPAIRRYDVSQKRSVPETDEEFLSRLISKCSEPGMYHREMIDISEDQIQTIQAELWELSKAMLEARKRKAWYMNPTMCFRWNKPCAYWKLCRASPAHRELIEQNFYDIVPPHEELMDVETEAI